MSAFYALTIVAVIPVLSFLFYTLYVFYVHWKYSHLPGPKRDCFYRGHFPSLQRGTAKGQTMAQMWLELYIKHGRMFVFWVFHEPILVVCDPKLLKKCIVSLNLLKSPEYKTLGYVFGERMLGRGLFTEIDHQVWKKKRKNLDHAFHRGYLMSLMSAFNYCCDELLAKMGEFADGQTTVDMAEQFTRVTLDVIGKVAFGVDINAIKDADSPFLSAISKCLQGVHIQISTPHWKYCIPMYPFQRNVAQAAKFLRKFGAEVIKKRQKAVRRGEGTPDDILAHILRVAEHDTSRTLDDLTDEFVTFFLAGHETTSNHLSFTLYELLKHPDSEERLTREITEVLQSSHYVDYQDLGKLQYLSQVLKESMRLHPPVPATGRIFSQDEILDGYMMPAGTRVNFSQYVSHHSPEVWDNPEEFNPDRFDPSSSEQISNNIYWPFSLGPRNCIGQTFAKFEVKVIMARLLQEYQFELVPGQEDLKYDTEALTLRPKRGVLCTVRKREKHPQNYAELGRSINQLTASAQQKFIQSTNSAQQQREHCC